MILMEVIIPVRISSDRKDILDRLSYHLLDTQIPENIQFVVADDGSSPRDSNRLQKRCLELGIRYINSGVSQKVFSAGRARNLAARTSDAKYILFQDIDLMPYPGFYQDALDECIVQKLDVYADRFVMFGVIYLSKEATEEFITIKPEFRRSLFINYLLEGKEDKIEKFSTGTSVTIWRRDHYLCTGGNDPEFEGWGYEDLEYVCRAVRRNRVFPLPVDFSLDYRNFSKIYEYKGWKSIYRLFGDKTAFKGMFMFHSWHPVDSKGNYMKLKEKNKVVFDRKLKEFATKNIEPEALSRTSKGKSLLFRSNPWVLNRWTQPNLGDITIIDESYFDDHDFIQYFRENSFDRVIFHNPYANEKMLNLYRLARGNDINYIVCERGALRDSVFFDPKGFNADSSSYSPSLWDKTLSMENYNKTLEYIRLECLEESSLELQAKRLSKSELRKKLGIKKGAKILFVPLQRPSDTVIKYLSGSIKSYDNFISLIEDVSNRLGPKWVVVVKKHPLEVDYPELTNVVYANDENINSLLDFCDAVTLINSGVGVSSLMFNKPTFVAGDAFYNHNGLAYTVSDADSLLDNINKFKPDYEKVIRFISYLINDFYSFGKFTTRLVEWEGGGKMTATTGIDFYEVRYPGEPELILEKSTKPRISHNSILFDRYKNSSGNIQVVNFENNIKEVDKAHTTTLYDQNQDVHLLKKKGSKILKLKESPKRFFEESKKPIIKYFARFFK